MNETQKLLLGVLENMQSLIGNDPAFENVSVALSNLIWEVLRVRIPTDSMKELRTLEYQMARHLEQNVRHLPDSHPDKQDLLVIARNRTQKALHEIETKDTFLTQPKDNVRIKISLVADIPNISDGYCALGLVELDPHDEEKEVKTLITPETRVPTGVVPVPKGKALYFVMFNNSIACTNGALYEYRFVLKDSSGHLTLLPYRGSSLDGDSSLSVAKKYATYILTGKPFDFEQ